eukprot:3659271-Amphidinium_carterae.1
MVIASQPPHNQQTHPHPKVHCPLHQASDPARQPRTVTSPYTTAAAMSLKLDLKSLDQRGEANLST